MASAALVTSESEDEIIPFRQQLMSLGYAVFWCPLGASTQQLRSAIVTEKPTAVVVVCSRVGEPILVRLRHIMAQCSEPVLVFTGDDDPTMIDQALRAGVAAYVVDPDGVTRLPAILRVAIARCRLEQQRRLALFQAQQSLEERKTIERAKGVLMWRKGLTEPEAYQLLRKTAMSNNEKMFDVAKRVVAVTHPMAEVARN